MSACYFFKIDKDNIIDATCKGGIARFVNHSCLVRLFFIGDKNKIVHLYLLLNKFSSVIFAQPNCAAKVISVKNEKKVITRIIQVV